MNLATRFAVCAISTLMLESPTLAQTCRSLLNDGVCQAPRGVAMDFSTLSSSRGQSDYRRGDGSLGSDLVSRDDDTATFAAITFGGGRKRCSGLFRTTDC